jgi:uncharacterized membrane protein
MNALNIFCFVTTLAVVIGCGALLTEADPSRSRKDAPTFPRGYYAAGLAAVFVSFVVSLAQYPSLPDKIIKHFDFRMVPDAWMDKSLGTVLMMPAISLIMLIFMWGAGVLFDRSSLRTDPLNPALSFAQNRMYRRQMGHALGLTALSATVMFVLIGFMSIWPDFRLPFWWHAIFWAPQLISVVVVSARSGQGGCKLKPKMTETEAQNDRNGSS